ncbi:MAG TPA: glycosyl hydrolase [Chloroflexota bacterium]|nr:glycosyl hydrolase [Chloroflexota bacterium]
MPDPISALVAERTAGPDLSEAAVWRLLGPHRGGRVVAVAGDPTEPMEFYFGACAGGVWKTTDGGTYWRNVSDGFFSTAAVGAIAVAASDPNVVYVGTGESTIRGNVSHGDGVYRSTDAGKTWRNMGLADTRHIAKVRVHPHDPNLVYVAALGHAWGPNRERGVYRSRDGGQTWEQILFRTEQAGAIDLSMDPRNPRILYAAFWEARRFPHKLVSGGEGSSLYRSTDGGDTWTELTANPGLPKGVKGKIGVAVSPARPGRVWALVEAEDGALFRSDDGGDTWTRLSEEGDLRRRAWYYMHVYADPQDAETVWVLNLQCWRSTDGGKTFAPVPTPHGDNHDLWIDPRDPRRLIEGNDGGACVSFNSGDSWSTLYNQPTAQFYHVTTDSQTPYRVYGSQQDNTAISLPSLSSRGAITSADWYEPGGGESGYIAVRPDDPTIVYAGAIGSGSFNGRLLRYDHRTGQERNITVWPEEMGMGDGADTLKYRFQWTFPVLLSPHDPKVLYVGGNHLFRSTDEGSSWEEISPDLSRNDPATLEPSGGPITRDNTGAEVYGTIFAFVESPRTKGEFWVGTDDGLVHLSRDGGATWRNITPSNLPEWSLISVIELSPRHEGAAYLAAIRYKHDDATPYLYKTSDYGQTWQPITSGIPAHDFTRVIRADPAREGVLYAGTEIGVYVSYDDGSSWRRLAGNLPVVPIHDLEVRDDDLIAATHGRSFWILDDLTPVRHMADEAGLAAPRLFAPRPTTRYKIYQGYGYKPGPSVNYRMAGPLVVSYTRREQPGESGRDVFLDAGENPPQGAIVYYFLPHEPEGEISLSFLDRDGKQVRRFIGVPEPTPDTANEPKKKAEGGPEEPRLPRKVGINRFVWDLRIAPAHKVPGDKSTEEALAGPVVPPGEYEVMLTVAGHTESRRWSLRADPRVAATQTDFEAQYTLLLAIRDKLSETHDAINQLRDLRDQLAGWEARAGRVKDGEPLKTAIGALKEQLASIEDALIQVKAADPRLFPARLNEKLAILVGAIDSDDGPPTRQAQAVFADLSARIDAARSRLWALLDADVPALNALLRDHGVPALVPAPSPQE